MGRTRRTRDYRSGCANTGTVELILENPVDPEIIALVVPKLAVPGDESHSQDDRRQRDNRDSRETERQAVRAWRKKESEVLRGLFQSESEKKMPGGTCRIPTSTVHP